MLCFSRWPWAGLPPTVGLLLILSTREGVRGAQWLGSAVPVVARSPEKPASLASSKTLLSSRAGDHGAQEGLGRGPLGTTLPCGHPNASLSDLEETKSREKEIRLWRSRNFSLRGRWGCCMDVVIFVDVLVPRRPSGERALEMESLSHKEWESHTRKGGGWHESCL